MSWHGRGTTCDIGKPCHGMGQAQQCGWVKPVNLRLSIIGSATTNNAKPERFASTQKDHSLSQKYQK